YLFIFLFLAVEIAVVNSLSVFADPGYSSTTFRQGYVTHRDFVVTPQLKPRVDFWIDIFARYHKNEFVIHHRKYPFLVFRVVKLGGIKFLEGTRRFERYKRKLLKKEIRETENILKRLLKGATPRTSVEREVFNNLALVPLSYKTYLRKNITGQLRAQGGIREEFAEALRRSGRYMHIIKSIFVDRYGLPLELTRLPFVESSFNYNARSAAGASGIWQFMPRTARIYGLKVNYSLDERRDIIASTDAAARYLRDAYNELLSWQLAVTSYNHGVYGVKRKIKKHRTRSLSRLINHPRIDAFGFASSNFFAELLAAVEVYNNRSYYFPEVKLEPPVHMAVRRLPYSVSVTYLVSKLGVPLAEFKSLNNALSWRVWKGYRKIPAGYLIKVPLKYKRKLAALTIPPPRTSFTFSNANYYRVRRGDTLIKIGRRFNISVKELKRLNNLKRDVIKVGQVIKIAPSSTKKSYWNGIHTVRRGETLSYIARRYKVSLKDLRRVNNLSSSLIKVGQRLKVPSRSKGEGKIVGSKGSYMTYKVKSGDTLWTLSKRFGTSISAIKRASNLRSSKLIKGQKLRIPRK
ncbi:MAG: LysM peptidoglycan-binding domain-containing protein, partial [Candidatus Dadabacteria bacterium]